MFVVIPGSPGKSIDACFVERRLRLPGPGFGSDQLMF